MGKRKKTKKKIRVSKPGIQEQINNQKELYERLVINSITKSLTGFGVKLKDPMTEENVSVINKTLCTMVRDVWGVLRGEGRLLLPLEAVSPSFKFKKETGEVSLHLPNALISLANGTLNPKLAPIVTNYPIKGDI